MSSASYIFWFFISSFSCWVPSSQPLRHPPRRRLLLRPWRMAEGCTRSANALQIYCFSANNGLPRTGYFSSPCADMRHKLLLPTVRLPCGAAPARQEKSHQRSPSACSFWCTRLRKLNTKNAFYSGLRQIKMWSGSKYPILEYFLYPVDCV